MSSGSDRDGRRDQKPDQRSIRQSEYGKLGGGKDVGENGRWADGQDDPNAMGGRSNGWKNV